MMVLEWLLTGNGDHSSSFPNLEKKVFVFFAFLFVENQSFLVS